MLNAILAAAEEEAASPNPLLPEAYDIIWSAVCFAIILFFFVWKFLPAIKKTLDARAEQIEGGIKKAEIAQAEAAAALDQYTAQLAEGRAEAAKIRDHQLWMAGAMQDGAIYDRAKLCQGDVIPGPAIVTEMDSTTLIETGCVATVDAVGNILINLA